MMNWAQMAFDVRAKGMRMAKLLEADLKRINEYSERPNADQLLAKARIETIGEMNTLLNDIREIHALMVLFFRDERARILNGTNDGYRPGINPTWETYEQILKQSLKHAWKNGFIDLPQIEDQQLAQQLNVEIYE